MTTKVAIARYQEQNDHDHSSVQHVQKISEDIQCTAKIKMV
jgi:hypothetical protein